LDHGNKQIYRKTIIKVRAGSRMAGRPGGLAARQRARTTGATGAICFFSMRCLASGSLHLDAMAQPAGSPPEGAFARRVLLTAAVIVLLLLIWALHHVLLMAFASVLIAIGFNAMAMTVATHTPLSRGWSLVLSILAVVALIAGAFWLFGAQVGAQVRELVTRVPQAWEDLRALLEQTGWGTEALDQLQNGDALQGAQGAMGALGRLGGWTLSFAGAALDAFLVVIGGIFLAADPGPYRNG
jgi:predicted PurR-regulated permease PerM